MSESRSSPPPAVPVVGIALAILASFVPMAGAYTRPGDLDVTFGRGGTALVQAGVSPRSSSAAALALQTDGKIIAAGTAQDGAFALVRLTSGGAPDTGFGGGDGIALTPGLAGAHAVALQADGRVLVAGEGAAGSGRAAIARYDDHGALDDAAFGSSGGITQTSFGDGVSTARFTATAVEPDGEIVAVGSLTRTAGDPGDIIVARYLPDGTLDSRFAEGGAHVVALGPGADAAAGLVVLDDGRIIVGATTDDGTRLRGAVMRLLPDGTPDPSFGLAGTTTFDIGLGLTPGSGRITEQPDGRLLFSGGARRLTGSGTVERVMTVTRLEADGLLDTGFAAGGTAFVAGDDGLDGAGGGLAVQRNGEILVGGSAFVDAEGHTDFALACIDPGGPLSNLFGESQPVVVRVDDAHRGRIRALALRGDSEIVAAGQGDSDGTQMAFARFVGGCLPSRQPPPPRPPAPPPTVSPPAVTVPREPSPTTPGVAPAHPRTRVSLPRRIKLRSAAAHGLHVGLRLDRAVTVLATLRRGRRTLATASVRCAATGSCVVRLRPAGRVLRRVLGRRRDVALEVVLQALTREDARVRIVRTVLLRRS